MNKVILLIYLLCSSISFSQQDRVPSIVVLSPLETIFDKGTDTIAKYYKHKGKLTAAHQQRIREANGEEFSLKSDKEILFLEDIDLGSNISLGINIYLSFKLFEYHENHMVFPAHEKNNSTRVDLKRIADKYNMNWVVNIPSVEFQSINKGYTGEVHFQLYNQKFDEIVLDSILNVDDENPGFTFACQSGTIDCVVNNLTSEISNKVLRFLNENRNYWR